MDDTLEQLLTTALVDFDRESYLVFLDLLEENHPEEKLLLITADDQNKVISVFRALSTLSKLFPDVVRTRTATVVRHHQLLRPTFGIGNINKTKPGTLNIKRYNVDGSNITWGGHTAYIHIDDGRRDVLIDQTGEGEHEVRFAIPIKATHGPLLDIKRIGRWYDPSNATDSLILWTSSSVGTLSYPDEDAAVQLEQTLEECVVEAMELFAKLAATMGFSR